MSGPPTTINATANLQRRVVPGRDAHAAHPDERPHRAPSVSRPDVVRPARRRQQPRLPLPPRELRAHRPHGRPPHRAGPLGPRGRAARRRRADPGRADFIAEPAAFRRRAAVRGAARHGRAAAARPADVAAAADEPVAEPALLALPRPRSRAAAAAAAAVVPAAVRAARSGVVAGHRGPRPRPHGRALGGAHRELHRPRHHARERAGAVPALPDHQGPARARPRRGHQGVRGRGPRHGRDAPRLHADPVRRRVVGDGLMVELVIASVALYVWLGAQPGVARSLAHYAIILAGISTVLFNGNPLLRYDGYYMLVDLLEIPNLYTRSRTWLGWAAERYLFGVLDAEPPQATPGERVWFVLYGVGSFLYRILVVVAIAFFLLDRVFYVAVGLLLLTLSMWVVVPLMKGVRYLAHSPRLRRTRTRAVLVTSGVALAVVLLLAIIPMPHRTRAEGVVWVPEEALVRPDTEGFIERLAARPGVRVKPGDALVVLGNQELASREAVAEARVRELRARYDAERPNDTVRMQIVEEELRYSVEELARVRQRLAGLILRANTEGTFIIPQPESLPGRFVKKGDLLAYVLDLQRVTVRAVVGQANIDLVRHRRHGIEVRLAE